MTSDPTPDRPTGSRDDEAETTRRPHVVHTTEGTLTVLDHQVRFERAGSSRVFELPASQIRRVQVDIELGRPASVAIVPNSGGIEAQLLTVHREEFEALSTAILHLAVDLDDASRGG